MFYKKTNQLSWLWLSALVIAIDHITKVWMSYWLDGSSVIPVFPCLNFILTHNSGAAFSFLGWADGWQRWLFVAISLGASIYLIRVLYKGGHNKWIACAIALIIGGAIGNLYDRLTLGYVVDFIDFCIGYWHFATFNLADSAISIGAVMWVIASYKSGEK
ncbi:MAG: signal peptidase II [Pseudomonadota bacterium]